MSAPAARILRCEGDPLWGEGEAGARWTPRPLVFDSLGFVADYEVAVLPTPDVLDPGTPRPTGGRPEMPWEPGNGLLLGIRRPGGPEKRVALQAGHRFSGFAEGVFATPHPGFLLVALGDSLWRVPAADPAAAERVPAWATALVALPGHGLLAVVDTSTVVGLGPDGPLWETGQVALDGIRIAAVDGTMLLGRASFSSMTWPDDGLFFKVDLATGESWGGWGGPGEGIPPDAPRGAPPARTWPLP